MSATVTRRGALGRLLGLGAGAAAAVALPALPARAEPVAPPTVEVLPDWLTADPELTPGLERLARAMAAYPGPKDLMVRLLDHQAEFIEHTTATWNDPRPEPKPAPAPAPERARRVDGDRIVTLRLDRLTVNERRRVRRWLAALPRGEADPIVSLRLGDRWWGSGEAPYDFLDVAAPIPAYRPSPIDHGRAVAEAYTAKFGGEPCTIVCAHHGLNEPGAITGMGVFSDGRVTRNVYEIGA